MGYFTKQKISIPAVFIMGHGENYMKISYKWSVLIFQDGVLDYTLGNI